MPFTFAHPALVLPLMRLPKRFVSVTALIAGAIAPDFEYFIRMNCESHFSHSWLGGLLFSFPMAFILAFAFHYLLRDVLIDNLPPYFKSRFQRFSGMHFGDYFKSHILVFAASAAIGVASHILLDSLTHEGRFLAELLPFMSYRFSAFGISVPLYKFAQYFFSLAGLVAIFYAIRSLPTSRINANYSYHRFWVFSAAMGVAVLALKALFAPNYIGYADEVVTLMSGGIIGTLTFSIFYKLKIIILRNNLGAN